MAVKEVLKCMSNLSQPFADYDRTNPSNSSLKPLICQLFHAYF